MYEGYVQLILRKITTNRHDRISVTLVVCYITLEVIRNHYMTSILRLFYNVDNFIHNSKIITIQIFQSSGHKLLKLLVEHTAYNSQNNFGVCQTCSAKHSSR